LRLSRCLEICQLSKHQYYYQPKGGKRGRKPSKQTDQLGSSGQVVTRSNTEVVEAIKQTLANPRKTFGYRAMSYELQLQGWYINHKKVYRLMKAARLLCPKKPKVAKNYVQYRVVCPKAPLRLIEMDIKQVWIPPRQRYAYILTIIDVFTRFVLDYRVDFQMKQASVRAAWEAVIENWMVPSGTLAWQLDIEVRSDNGPQFCAKSLSAFLAENYFKQTFTHPYTPQENGHVESFHAILGADLRGHQFNDLEALKRHLAAFYNSYNYHRVHGSTCGLPPALFWQQWEQGQIKHIIIDEKKRKAKFQLLSKRQELTRFEPVGNGNLREVWSLIFEGSTPDKIKPIPSEMKKSDAGIPILQPVV